MKQKVIFAVLADLAQKPVVQDLSGKGLVSSLKVAGPAIVKADVQKSEPVKKGSKNPVGDEEAEIVEEIGVRAVQSVAADNAAAAKSIFQALVNSADGSTVINLATSGEIDALLENLSDDGLLQLDATALSDLSDQLDSIGSANEFSGITNAQPSAQDNQAPGIAYLISAQRYSDNTPELDVPLPNLGEDLHAASVWRKRRPIPFKFKEIKTCFFLLEIRT